MVIFIVATTTIAAATSNSCKVLTLEEMWFKMGPLRNTQIWKSMCCWILIFLVGRFFSCCLPDFISQTTWISLCFSLFSLASNYTPIDILY
jgi:hypothetical protein